MENSENGPAGGMKFGTNTRHIPAAGGDMQAGL